MEQIRKTLLRCWEIVSRKRALGASHDLLRVFLVCSTCGRVVPYYRATATRLRVGQRYGCACGSQSVRVGIPSYLTGAAWVLGCLAWRKWIRRLGDAWDPRAPIHASELR